MESRVEDRTPQDRTPTEVPEDEQRWGSILQKVVNEQESNDPWYVKLGVSLAWSAGIALAAGIVAALVLAVRSLLSADLQYTFRNLSDHIFWVAALIMIAGMFSPSAAELDRSRDKNKEQQRRPLSAEEKRTLAMERRLRRVYDPWRWRIWGGAALTFGLAILSGLLAKPVP